jgi:PAS domain S-box-containing protein
LKKTEIDGVAFAFIAIFCTATLFLFIEYIEITKVFTSYKTEILQSLHQQNITDEKRSHAIIETIDNAIFQAKLTTFAKFLIAAVIFFSLYIAFKRERSLSSQLRQYKSFVDRAAIVSKTDTKGIITYANDAFVKISGYKRKELLGKPHSIVRHPDVPSSFFEGLWKRLQSGKPWSGKFRNMAKNKKEYTVSAHIFPIFNHKGKIVEYIAIRHDITKLEQAKQDQEKMLMHRSKLASIGEMVDSAAHQWKQPVNIIKMKVDMLYYDFDDGEVDKKYIETFKTETMRQFTHMEETLDAFRSFLRPDTKQELFSVKACCQNVMLLIKDELTHNQIYVVTDIKNDFSIYGIQNEFKHLVLNILSNAKDAFLQKRSEDKIITVEVFTRNDYGYLQISDNAGGIPEAILPTIFKANVTSKPAGTGMGMYMSKKIALKHGGDLTVKNSTQGAVFTFSKRLNA